MRRSSSTKEFTFIVQGITGAMAVNLTKELTRLRRQDCRGRE